MLSVASGTPCPSPLAPKNSATAPSLGKRRLRDMESIIYQTKKESLADIDHEIIYDSSFNWKIDGPKQSRASFIAVDTVEVQYSPSARTTEAVICI